MVCIEKIISRGADGPELEALVVARLWGVATGGNTRIFRSRKRSGVVRRFGLAADPCSRRQAMLRNLRQADGTLVFGRFGRATEALLKAERTTYCCIERLQKDAGALVLAWLASNRIRTLNIIGRSDADVTYLARVVMLDVLHRIGRQPRLPLPASAPVSTAAVIAGPDACYAVVPWPKPTAWRCGGEADRWHEVADWKSLRFLERSTRELAWVTDRLWNLMPVHVRGWVICECPAPGPEWDDEFAYDLGLLEVLGRLGKRTDDLARAGRWAILRLTSDAGALLSPQPAGEAKWIAADALLARRQREIVGSFGFPATESAARILAKLPRESCSAETLMRLRELMSNSWSRRVLQSLPRINRVVVRVLADPWLRRVVGPRLLRQIAACPRQIGAEAQFSFLLNELRDETDRIGTRASVRAVHSTQSLERVVEELQRRPRVPTIPPPRALPGMAGIIEPLIDGRALFLEGRAMRHCARRYARYVRDGYCLMFRILPNAAYGTSRATLQLTPQADGTWKVAQLSGAANAPADAGTTRFVNAWLFCASCDPGGSENELARACLGELATSTGMGYLA